MQMQNPGGVRVAQKGWGLNPGDQTRRSRLRLNHVAPVIVNLVRRRVVARADKGVSARLSVHLLHLPGSSRGGFVSEIWGLIAFATCSTPTPMSASNATAPAITRLRRAGTRTADQLMTFIGS